MFCHLLELKKQQKKDTFNKPVNFKFENYAMPLKSLVKQKFNCFLYIL